MHRFYALHTVPGRERKAKSDLEHRFRNLGVAAQVRQIVVPETVQVDIAADGSRKERVVNPVPGYLLIEAEITPQLWGMILMTPGVHAVGAHGKPPTPLSSREVDVILQRKTNESAAAAAAASRSFAVGDIVEIVAGPFSGWEAAVVESDADHEYLRVEIVLFERVVPLQLGYAEVRLKHRASR